MFEQESIIVINTETIQNIFNQYQIQLNYYLDIIHIKIQHNYNTYESNINLGLLNKLLVSNFTIDEMIKFINELINQSKIKIEEYKDYLKLILISNNSPHLILNKKNIISNEVIEKLIKEINEIKEENNKLKNRIESIENKNAQLIKRIELIENNNNELNNKIKILELFNKEKHKIKLTKSNLHFINSIQPHKHFINSISTFPSGNIISVSADKSIKIYDIHLNELQTIENAHDDSIIYVEVKDENNFITCSDDKSIKLWIKNEKEYINNKIINKAHDDYINRVIYCSNGNLISCSYDNTIKIWKENNNNYENIKILVNFKWVASILFLEDKNILISSGEDGTKFWDLNGMNNINCIKYFEDTFCGWHDGICRLDEDRIIVQGRRTTSLKIISILNLKIIKEFNIPFQCNSISLIEDKGIFIVGGKSKDIKIYRNDNYECIQTIPNAHDDNINGFIELKDYTIASFSDDKTIKIWCF